MITGATGFIGANLLRRLLDLGCRPHISLRRSSDTWRITGILNKVKPHYFDLSNREATFKAVCRIKPQVIYHCATYGGYSFQDDYASIMRINVAGTSNLLDACLENGFYCFINTGSSSEYGLKNRPMREDDLLDPVSEYGAAKAAATLFCQAKAGKYKLPVITLRLFSPYGPYEDSRRLVASLIFSCLKNRAPALSSARPVRDFVFIEDVLGAYVKATARINKISGEIINIGSGRQYSIGEMTAKVIKLADAGVKPRWGVIDNPLREPLFWRADISKAERLLGWHPAHNIDEGLEKTICWFRKNFKIYG